MKEGRKQRRERKEGSSAAGNGRKEPEGTEGRLRPYLKVYLTILVNLIKLLFKTFFTLFFIVVTLYKQTNERFKNDRSKY